MPERGRRTFGGKYATGNIVVEQKPRISPTLNIITRDVWGAKPGMRESYWTETACKVFFTYTHSLLCYTVNKCASTLRTLQGLETHYNKKDIPYNFIIGADCNVYEGRGFGVMPSLPIKYHENNAWSLYIAYIGKPEEMKEVNTLEMDDVRSKLISLGVSLNLLEPDHGFHIVVRTK